LDTLFALDGIHFMENVQPITTRDGHRQIDTT